MYTYAPLGTNDMNSAYTNEMNDLNIDVVYLMLIDECYNTSLGPFSLNLTYLT